MFHELKLVSNDPSQRILWLTDLHLDAASPEAISQLFHEIKALKPDHLLIGGDISNGPHTFTHMQNLHKSVPCPLYFVLGNHDFYYSSIAETRERACKFASDFSNVRYLTTEEVLPLSPSIGLVGHDGWSDARAGNFFESRVFLNDYIYIEELAYLTAAQRLEILHELGDEAAQALKQRLEKAFELYDQIILLTHPPPFEESCCYGGKPCDWDWAPHFVCQAVGDMLLKVMELHKDKQIIVFCGHAHYGVDLQVLPNLRVLTGHSELGDPTIQGCITLGANSDGQDGKI